MKRDRLSAGPPTACRRRVAVVGSGVSGLLCGWLLARRFDVTVYESGDRVGGHTNTVDVDVGGLRHPVDTGFLVFNRRTYPQLCALFAWLGVDADASDMSFSVSIREPELEWSGSSLAGVFAQRRNLARPAFLAMLRDIVRFNAAAREIDHDDAAGELSLGDYLQGNRFGHAFRDWYLLPMAAAIWSCPTSRMLEFPLRSFVRFCNNHGLLQVFDRPQWLTVRGGGREYLRRLTAGVDRLHLSTSVHDLLRERQGVWLFSDRGAERYDEVVLACHSDQALRILGGGADADERSVLSAIAYQPNTAWLHTDVDLLPRRRAAWSAWNYLAGPKRSGHAPVSVSYLINRLQPLPFDMPVVVTLNPWRAPADRHVLGRFDYAHPVFDAAAVTAQSRLAEIQGRGHVWYAGAWTGYGFHEDGVRSAIAVANSLGVSVPWRVDARGLERA
ncbi:MAG: FAD-dependent oxidoreductase [Rhodocyclaceae bacterium]|nr:FAD-dependent oxidoreductase [Rhodocyclaceae bacterium]